MNVNLNRRDPSRRDYNSPVNVKLYGVAREKQLGAWVFTEKTVSEFQRCSKEQFDNIN